MVFSKKSPFLIGQTCSCFCERHSNAASRERKFKTKLFADEAGSERQNAGPPVLRGEEEKRKGKKCPKTKWMSVRPTSFSGDPGPLHQGNRVEEKLL
jgi:hypothetical protein